MWLYKCQEGAGELLLGKGAKFDLSPKKDIFLVEEHFVTLPVFIQPGCFSTSTHVGFNSTDKWNDQFISQLIIQSFNTSVTIQLSHSLVNSEALRSIDEDRVYGTNETGVHLNLSQISLLNLGL